MVIGGLRIFQDPCDPIKSSFNLEMIHPGQLILASGIVNANSLLWNLQSLPEFREADLIQATIQMKLAL